MTCPGRHLALFQMSKLMATVFLAWDLAFEDPSRPWRTRSSMIVQGYDWRVRIARRKQVPAAHVSVGA